MNIQSFVYGPVGANMYVLTFGKQAIVIDPCCPWEKTDLPSDIRVVAVFCTHGHFDHITEADGIVSRFSCPLYISSEDSAMLPDPELNHSTHFGLDVSVKAEPVCWEKSKFCSEELGISGEETFTITIISTPGHTSGSVCILFESDDWSSKYMFTGDMLFRGSVGRTDLGGSESQMIHSIDVLRKMDDDIICYPGHDSSTSLGREKIYNPFFLN